MEASFSKRYIDLIEGVQRRATKLTLDLKDKSYEDRLRCLNLTTQETRRFEGDLMFVKALKMLIQ